MKRVEQLGENGLGQCQRIAWALLVGVAIALLPACDSTESHPLTSSQAPFESRLVEHLRKTGAKMYGAYWCPHCANQKAVFGQVVDRIPYIECDPGGANTQAQLCRRKGIRGYPTWEIEGKFYEGERSLNELANLSHFSSRQ